MLSDAAILLGVITAIDPADEATVASKVRSTPDYTAALKPDGLKGSRIGVAPTRYFGYSPAADKLIDRAIADMNAQGATVIDPANIPTAARLDDCEFEILLYEFKADLNKYLASRGASAPVHSLKDLITGASSTPAAVAGYPSITVPAGFVHGLPVGISFIGRPWTEAKLISLGYAYEQATKHRKPPTFPGSVRLD